MMHFNFQCNIHALMLILHMYTSIILSQHIQTNIYNEHKDLTMPLYAVASFIQSLLEEWKRHFVWNRCPSVCHVFE